MRKKIKGKDIVIDGNSIFMRYFYAIPEQFNSDGIPVNGLMAFCRFILNIIRDYSPSSLLVVFDKCYDNFRRQISVDYKTNRTKLSTSAKDQLNLSLDFCRNAGIPVEFHAEYEGDDLIGSFVYQNQLNNFVIITTDKDLCQLVNHNVNVFNPFTKTLLDTDSVFEKYQIAPSKFHLFLALTGDSSDNIKGIEGVGPKTAVKILNSMDSDFDTEKAMKLFPKYNFTDWSTQLQLVSIKKDVKLINERPVSIQLNHEYIDEFIRMFTVSGMYGEI